jgi:sarcosine oxidase subunit beta
VAAAAYEPESGYADPVATTTTLMDRARELGVELFEDTAVRSIRTEAGRVTGLDTTAGPLEAAVVVCAANTWSSALLRTAGVDLPLGLRRTQVAFYRRPAPPSREQLVLIDTTNGLYARSDGPERVLAGNSGFPAQTPSDPDRYNEGVDPTFPAYVRAHLARRLPPLAEAPFDNGQAGLYDMSPDTRAILDRAPEVDGLYIAAGFSGTGFKKAPAVGACMAELIAEGRARTVELTPFRLARFAEGTPLHGPDEYRLPTDWGHAF